MFAGLDVGSRTTKLVVLNGDNIESNVVESGLDPLRRCRELLAGRRFDRIVVTGYGRHLAAPVLGGETVSEIKAFAVGARHAHPACHTVIDVGGQDSKVILLTEKGDVQKFEMNDRCAAGTGKFLEVMARTLEVDISEIGGLALSASKTVRINSLCTVFAESEVVSLVAKGEEANAIAMALHESIVSRLETMVRRVGVKDSVVFAGGGSFNGCLRRLLAQKLQRDIAVPESPQIIGALGAVLLAKSAKIAA
jgi:predicted CoA-substrate-specific enzyme activase